MKIIHHTSIIREPVSHDPDIIKGVILRRGDVDNIMQMSFTRFLPGQSTTAHAHKDMTEIYTIEQGSACFTINDRACNIEGPATVVINAGESHSMKNISDQPLDVHYTGVLASGAPDINGEKND